MKYISWLGTALLLATTPLYPQPTITQAYIDSTGNLNVEGNGAAESGSLIVTYIDGRAQRAVCAAADGSWSFSNAFPLLSPDSTPQVFVREINGCATSTSAIVTVPFEERTVQVTGINGIDPSTLQITTGPSILISGAAPAGTTITIYFDGSSLQQEHVFSCSTTANSDNQWEILCTGLPARLHTLYVDGTDIAIPFTVSIDPVGFITPVFGQTVAQDFWIWGPSTATPGTRISTYLNYPGNFQTSQSTNANSIVGIVKIDIPSSLYQLFAYNGPNSSATITIPINVNENITQAPTLRFENFPITGTPSGTLVGNMSADESATTFCYIDGLQQNIQRVSGDEWNLSYGANAGLSPITSGVHTLTIWGDDPNKTLPSQPVNYWWEIIDNGN